jgi:fructose-bisphosphate aldolase class II
LYYLDNLTQFPNTNHQITGFFRFGVQLPLVHNRSLFEGAGRTKAAIAAFNVISLEHAEGIAMGAEVTGLPVIMQLSENAINFHDGPYAIADGMKRIAESSSSPIALHLDHITDIELLKLAVEINFSSVMFDGSILPHHQNIELTKSATQWSHSHDLWIESELGEIGGKDGAHAPGVRTDPLDAASFVEQTGVDALAVAVGSSHAMISKTASLDHELIKKIADAVSVPLVLHGSSGVPDDELKLAAIEGMKKINIGTALNIAYTGAIRSFLSSNPFETDPRKYTAIGREAIAQTVSHYLKTVSD